MQPGEETGFCFFVLFCFVLPLPHFTDRFRGDGCVLQRGVMIPSKPFIHQGVGRSQCLHTRLSLVVLRLEDGKQKTAHVLALGGGGVAGNGSKEERLCSNGRWNNVCFSFLFLFFFWRSHCTRPSHVYIYTHISNVKGLLSSAETQKRGRHLFAFLQFTMSFLPSPHLIFPPLVCICIQGACQRMSREKLNTDGLDQKTLSFVQEEPRKRKEKRHVGSERPSFFKHQKCFCFILGAVVFRSNGTWRHLFYGCMPVTNEVWTFLDTTMYIYRDKNEACMGLIRETS